MDQRAAYEMIIAEKLEQLSAPEQVDAIWARIEGMLDTEMPADDGPGDPPVTPPSGRRARRVGGVAIFFAALIATMYFINKKPITNTGNTTTPFDSTTTIIEHRNNANNKPPPVNSMQPSRQPVPNKDAPVQPSVPLPVNMDSLLFKGRDVPAAVRTDSVMNSPPFTPVLTPPADTVKKKSRGVKGITDDDYRIVPKKDSVP